MSSEDSVGARAPDETETEVTDDQATLRAHVELLEEENERLRSEYTRARQSQYQRTAIGLGALGLVAALGGLLVPTGQTVLFALGGTGAFLSVLTYYLTPERFLPASLSRSVYEALASNESALSTELGLRRDRVYVPTESVGVRLFVPKHAEYTIPDDDALRDVFVVTDDDSPRGISLAPTGAGLADEFDRGMTTTAAAPRDIATQAGDALVEQFELVDSATSDADPTGGRITVVVDESAYGAVDQFDHPVASFLASVTARRLEQPVTAKTEPADDERRYRITLTWDTTEASDEAQSED
ncbi:hypothetical protein [Haloarcula marina]|uniref:hypothetical protein n=1 Tax=Haloarcula marina TaxID=2961574 RepID=UPI0020B8588A|nr:hypothetical protein [Halomicroarcula marina]